MRRLTITLDVAFGRDEDDQAGDVALDAMVERAHPDDVPEHAELDGRRRIGFGDDHA